MEESIAILTRSLGSFCNHLQSSCDALRQSVDRRPIPLDSASSTFIQCLNRRVSTASTDLNMLDSMSFGTVSFEELLGHCNEVYKANQTQLLQLQDQLKSFGYIPGEIDDEDESDTIMSTPMGLGSKDGMDSSSPSCEPTSVVNSIMKSFEEDPLMDESLSLKNLGLSDVCLATLASEGRGDIDEPDISSRGSLNEKQHYLMSSGQNAAKKLGVIEGGVDGDLKPTEAECAVVEVSRDDYESLPSYMKCLTSWEDLLAAVDKINSCLKAKEKTKGNFFRQDEITSIGLGPKARTYLLLLMRMNQVAVETIDGTISYKVL